MRNLCLIVAYDGTEFHGWQRQPTSPTIQATLEDVIGKITGEQITLHGSGRTDAGVHALNQVANFKTGCGIPAGNLVKALNNLLPPTIRVKTVSEAAETFHSRHDAGCKTYRYRILSAPVASPFVSRFVCHYPYPLDLKRIAVAAKIFEGEHDFTSFAASSGTEDDDPPNSLLSTPHSLSSVRTIFTSRILWRPRTSILIYEVCGSGFLHHMVRNIVGTLIEVGRGKLAPRDITEILEARDRTRAGPTAPASGLVLVKVEY